VTSPKEGEAALIGTLTKQLGNANALLGLLLS